MKNINKEKNRRREKLRYKRIGESKNEYAFDSFQVNLERIINDLLR